MNINHSGVIQESSQKYAAGLVSKVSYCIVLGTSLSISVYKIILHLEPIIEGAAVTHVNEIW